MTEHTMRLRREPFEKIAAGRKTVELRLYDEKRQQIRVGDRIRFTCEGAEVLTEVLGLYRFASFGELYAALPLTDFGYAEGETASPKDMEAYYSPAEQAAYGVVGIKIRLTEELK